MSGLKESYDSGNLIGIPSLGINLSKVKEVFPEVPHSAAEVIAGFQTGFPHATITAEGETPTHIQADMTTIWPDDDPEDYFEWKNTYIAVNSTGFSREPSIPERLSAEVGTLAITRQPRPDLEIRQVLSPDGQVTMEAGVGYKVASRDNWAIYHAATI